MGVADGGDGMLARKPWARRGGSAKVALALMLASTAMPVHAAEPKDPPSDEIVVTAQRRSESILQVPISITSYTQEKMDRQGVRSIDDLSRLTPSLRFARAAGSNSNQGSNIAIRGVSSDIGAATTAIYIDDTPIQVRGIGYFGGNPYPRVFDLERVEVLRGPQGTLFGAGAEGGAVRFITPQPSQSGLSLYGRAEIATTEKGALSQEAGAAVGAPLTSTLSFRASAWERRDGGYIDRIIPQTTTVIDKDINRENTRSARLAVTWAPVNALTITPSIYRQVVKARGRNSYWEAQSNLGDTDYVYGPSDAEPSRDAFTLSAVSARYDTGSIALVSNTSLFTRNNQQTLNYINYQSFLRSGNDFGTFANKDATNADAFLSTKQHNFIQEARLQSSGTHKLEWTVGLYYANARQTFLNLTESGRTPGVLVGTLPQYQGNYSFYEMAETRDKQLAGYANATWHVTDRLRLLAGARYTHTKFNLIDQKDGPVNSGRRTIAVASTKENPFTPRLGVQYDVSGSKMLYATASKGFRPGGGQLQVDPGFCAKDLATLNLTSSPTSFRSDSLWSYEVGGKGTAASGRILFDVNAYYLKWHDIQQSVTLPTCNNPYIDNLGNATGKGVDLSLTIKAASWLQLGVNAGYNRLTFDQTIRGGGGVVLREKGDKIGGPNWTGSAFFEATHDLSTDISGYLRGDYTFQAKGYEPNRNVFSYNPGLPALPASDYLTLRLGARIRKLDLSIFANNVANTNKPLARNNNGVGGQLIYRESYRPRTIGLTAAFRY